MDAKKKVLLYFLSAILFYAGGFATSIFTGQLGIKQAEIELDRSKRIVADLEIVNRRERERIAREGTILFNDREQLGAERKQLAIERSQLARARESFEIERNRLPIEFESYSRINEILRDSIEYIESIQRTE